VDKTDMIKQAIKQAVGITDEDFKTYISYPHNLRIAETTPQLMKYKIIAEVTQAQYCTAGLKKGQKFTFQALPALLLPEESDCPPCARALAPLGSALAEWWEKIAKGDIQESKIVECLHKKIRIDICLQVLSDVIKKVNIQWT
jgi:uncharacterized repeat protein (TIGR04076 family)